jgi:hypothetical protein
VVVANGVAVGSITTEAFGSLDEQATRTIMAAESSAIPVFITEK